MRLNVVALIISLVVSFVLLEMTARVFRLAPEVTKIEINEPSGIFISSDNPRLKYMPKPNTGDINKYGLRDRVYSINKPNNVFRIIVLGDSIGFGFCTDEENIAVENTFAKVLENELNQISFNNFKNIEVINLSVSGYDTTQEVEFLEQKGLVMQPDLVIVLCCINDDYDASAELIAFRKKGMKWTTNYAKYIYLKSHLIRLVHYRLDLFKNEITNLLEKINKKDIVKSDIDRIQLGFNELKSLSEKYKFKTLVVIFPLFEEWNHYPRLKTHEKIQLEAEDNNFYCLDLLPIFNEASKGDFRSLQGRCNREHPDEYGHKVAAYAVKKYILDSRLVK